MLFAQESSVKEERFRERFPFRYEVRLGYGGTPLYDEDNFMYSGCCPDIYRPFPSLDNLYSVQGADAYMTGVISGEFSIHYRRWFTLAFNLGINGMWGRNYDSLNDVYLRKSGLSFNIMPVARFHWFTRPVVRMYTSVGLGLYAGWYDGRSEVTAAGMLVPVGISIGKKVFFFAESIYSTASFGGNLGLGYRF